MALGVCAAMLTLLATIGLLGQVVIAKHRAAAAADLSALAAADVVRGLSSGDACEVARQVAGKNGARVTECIASYYQQSVKVQTAVSLPRPFKAARQEAVAGAPEDPG
ncbi:hypothetical protein LWF01_13210 [Saxibacter everestensis]|uniref:Helicase/secretion neighborhood TadE-like protein n=1 Tax=Saxibacter everestensis TaxID=2909229 RepID=A0ABY8QRP1_9MICO|nr:hypothetical protein LWF01_13210 [Brevibacteriaceae bacterium ZFBP1038]